MTTTSQRPENVETECAPVQEPDNAAESAIEIPAVIQPPSRSEAVHWVFLVMALMVVALSFTMRVPGEERVYLPFMKVPVPGTCVSREVAGVECPGCGLTRSFISLAHGDFDRAWHFNPAGFLFFIVVAGQIPYRIVQLWRVRRGREVIRSKWINGLVYLMLFSLLLQWSVRRIMDWLSV